MEAEQRQGHTLAVERAEAGMTGIAVAVEHKHLVVAEAATASSGSGVRAGTDS